MKKYIILAELRPDDDTVLDTFQADTCDKKELLQLVKRYWVEDCGIPEEFITDDTVEFTIMESDKIKSL